MSKMMIGTGALKPMKVKKRKVSQHAGGHMPVGGDHKMAIQGSKNSFYDGKGDVLG